MKILRGFFALGLLCAAAHAQVEPLAVRTAREKCTTAQADAVRTYYRVLGTAAAKSLREKNVALQQTKDAAAVTNLAVEIKDLQAKVALYEALAKGGATMKVAARLDWQPALKIKAGSTIRVRAEGLWCSNAKARPANTCDADGNPGRNSGFLQARIDDGRVIKIGKSSTFTATEDGELQFEMHDAGKVDNDGILNVNVQIDPPADPATVAEEQKEPLAAYYKSVVAAEDDMLKALATALIQMKDPKIITAIAAEIDEAKQALALHNALLKGPAGYKIHANKGWQSTIAVTQGMTVHLRATGVWCANSTDRKNATFDADGRTDAYYLEAKIGKQEVRAGASCSFKIEEDGKLQFEMKDGVRQDNDGAITVYLSTDPAPEH